MTEIIVALSVLFPVTLWILLPENRRQREAKALARAAERLENRPHRHEWGLWSKPDVISVYAAGTSKTASKDSIPVRREYVQTRTCTTCGRSQRRVDHE